MGVLQNLFYDLTRPLRQITSKVRSVQNMKAGIAGDIDRIKRSVGITAKQASDKVKGPGEDPNKK